MAHIDTVRRLFSRSERLRRKKIELSPSVVKHDRLDEGVLDELREDARNFDPAFETPMVETPDVAAEVPEGEERPTNEEPYRPWEDLVSDIFYAHHTYNHPQVKAGGEVKQSRQLHRRIMEQVIHGEHFEETRKDTRMDGIASALTTLTVTDAVRELLEEELREAAERAQEMAQHEQAEQNATNANDAIRDQVLDDTGQQQQQLSDDQRQQMKANAQARANAAKAVEQLAQEQAQQVMGLDAAQAIDEATEQAKDDAEAASNLPGSSTGEMSHITPDEALALARKINDNDDVREVLKRFGRLERDMRYQRTNRVEGGREEIVDVTVGDDLTLMLPSEMVKLKHPMLRMDFMRRFYERNLLQYDMIGTKEAGNGPITVALDISSSMSGEKNWWARGVCLGLLSIAHREKRDFAVVEFDTQVKRTTFWNGREKIDPHKVIEFASGGVAGGTDITDGVQACRDIIIERPEFNKADIAIITDGQDSIGEDDKALKSELSTMGVRLHGVAIGMPSNAWLETICDDSASAYDLSAPSDATTYLAQALT